MSLGAMLPFDAPEQPAPFDPPPVDPFPETDQPEKPWE
jgi:hypothetical protein